MPLNLPSLPPRLPAYWRPIRYPRRHHHRRCRRLVPSCSRLFVLLIMYHAERSKWRCRILPVSCCQSAARSYASFPRAVSALLASGSILAPHLLRWNGPFPRVRRAPGVLPEHRSNTRRPVVRRRTGCLVLSRRGNGKHVRGLPTGRLSVAGVSGAACFWRENTGPMPD